MRRDGQRQEDPLNTDDLTLGSEDYLAALEGADPSILDPEPENQDPTPVTAEGFEDDKESPTAEPQPEQVPEPEATQAQDPNWNPEGPGNIRAALKESRQETRQLREQLNALQQQMQLQAQQQQQAQVLAQFEQLSLDDPDQAQAYLQQYQANLAAQAEQQVAQTRLQMSEEIARASMKPGEYDAQIAKFIQVFGEEGIQWAARQTNPAQAALSRLSTVYTKDDVETLVQNRIAEELAKLAPRLQAQDPKALRTIGNLPKAAVESETPQDKRIANAMNLTAAGTDDFDAAYRKLLDAAEG